jgi:hypothetical protein
LCSAYKGVFEKLREKYRTVTFPCYIISCQGGR